MINPYKNKKRLNNLIRHIPLPLSLHPTPFFLQQGVATNGEFKHSILYKLINKNYIEISSSLAEQHHKHNISTQAKLLSVKKTSSAACNCRIQYIRPLNGDCIVKSVSYQEPGQQL